MIRSSVVLPEPDGPSSAKSEPLGTSRLTLSSAVKVPKCLLMFLTEMLIRHLALVRRAGQLLQARGAFCAREALSRTASPGPAESVPKLARKSLRYCTPETAFRPAMA